jgi:hypothetical protein
MELFQFAKEESKAPIIFPEMTTVELEVTDYIDKPDYDGYSCVITAPAEFAGKKHTVFFRVNNEFNQRQYRTFLKTFFTDDDLTNKNWTPLKVVGSKITALADKPKEFNGKMYQNLTNWKLINNQDATPF